MDDMYQHSPGIAEQILDKRRAYQRQAMLDALNRQQVEANMQLHRDQMETNKVAREAQAEAAKALAVQRRLSGFTMGDEPSEEDYKWFQENGGSSYFSKPAESKIETVEGAQYVPPAEDDGGNLSEGGLLAGSGETITSTQKVAPKFRGTTEERQTLQDQLMFREMSEDPNMPEEVRAFARIRAASPKATVPPEIFKDHSKGHAVVYDPSSGGFITGPELGPNDKFIQESRAPQPPPTTISFIGMTGGQPVFAGNRIDPKTGKPIILAGDVPGDNPLDPKPSASGSVHRPLPAGIVQRYATAKGKASQPTGGVFGWGAHVDRKAQTEADTLAQDIINHGSTPAVRQAVRELLNDPLAMSADDDSGSIVATEYGTKMKPEEVAEVTDILYQIRAK